jgi:hypothetical protein
MSSSSPACLFFTHSRSRSLASTCRARRLGRSEALFPRHRSEERNRNGSQRPTPPRRRTDLLEHNAQARYLLVDLRAQLLVLRRRLVPHNVCLASDLRSPASKCVTATRVAWLTKRD